MRILVISNYYPPIELGGWEQLTSNVVNRLITRGHQIAVLTSNYRIEEIRGKESGIYRQLHLESYDPVSYHPKSTLFYRRQEEENHKTLTGIVHEFDPEVIFINGMWNLPYSVAKRAEELCPGRVVYYLASYWPTEPDAHTAYWTSEAESSVKQIPKKVIGSILRRSWIKGSPRNRLDFRMVLCVSAFVQDYVVRDAGVPKERTRVVHNGIELDWFTVKRAENLAGDLRLLYAGRLSPDKGVHTILEALTRLHQTDQDVPVRLSLYGKGTPEYETDLRKQVLDSGIEQWVEFKGLVPREQMPSVFAQHEALLFPSIWPEPLARILQEAMACELVVIGTATGGSNEILLDGENGLIFDAGDSAMLAEKIKLIVSDHSLRQKLAKAARKTVEERFSLDRMVVEIEECFEKILSQEEFVVE
jgi:glycosyltransferase involved in cell wall biosynthesis